MKQFEFGDGSNLIGNPYPSPVDWQVVYDDILEFPVAGLWQTNGTEYAGSILIWDAQTPSNSTLANSTIAIGQGFFIDILSTSSTSFNWQNKYRVSDNTPIFYRKSGLPGIDLKLSGLNNKDLTLIHFDDYNETDRPVVANARKWMNEKNSIYTISEGQFNTALNLPFPTNEILVSLGLRIADAGNYTLEASNFYFPDNGHSAFLHDRLTGKVIEINKDFQYHFTTEPGVFDDRFVIRFLNKTNVITNANISQEYAFAN